LETKQKLEGDFKDLSVYAAVADIVDEEAVKRAFQSITSQNGGKIDILVNNAEYLPDTRVIKECTSKDWFIGYEVCKP
jgi:NAD(P)-dependent dehydrogenase (short-subunit alcohol dehydrogenase family)